MDAKIESDKPPNADSLQSLSAGNAHANRYERAKGRFLAGASVRVPRLYSLAFE